MNPISINLAVEDELSEVVLRRILLQISSDFHVEVCYRNRGFGYLKKNIHAFNHAAKVIPYLVLTDLDQNECPPSLIEDWLYHPRHPHLLFRIAVREVEAWLLADREGIAHYFNMAFATVQKLVSINAEEIGDPKKVLIHLARKSRNKNLRDDIVPRSGSTSTQGPNYNGAIIPFVQKVWNIQEASQHAMSLTKAISAIQNLHSRLISLR